MIINYYKSTSDRNLQEHYDLGVYQVENPCARKKTTRVLKNLVPLSKCRCLIL